MAFRVFADVFVPAGGRNGSLNEQNWRQFLMEDGSPRSRLVVEGGCRFVCLCDVCVRFLAHQILPISDLTGST